MARQANLAVLVVVALASAAGVVAQTNGTALTGSLSDVQCLASADNRDAALAVAQNCGDLASGVTTSGTSINIDCPANCGSAFNSLTSGCKNALASSAALGATYRLIFNSCGVTYSGSGSTPTAGTAANVTAAPSAPTANIAVNGSEFTCLADDDNLDAGVRFARFCSGGALQPRPDGNSDVGFTVTCPANCSAALNDVSKSCINSIANSNSFGGIYQEIFRACKVSVSNSTTPTAAPTAATKAPTAAAATKAPTAAAATTAPTAATTDAPTAAAPDTPTDAPTTSGSTASDTPTDAPTAAPTAAPTQSASRAAGGLATFGAAATAAAALLTLLA